MKSRRITGRAAAVVTITVLFAGAAAAAAGGVLPGPFSADTAAEASATIGSGSTISDPTTGSGVTDPTSTDVTGTDSSTTTSPLPEAHGLCTAWNAGHEKKVDNPAFTKLQHAADEMHGTIDEYCHHVLDDHGDHDETEGTETEGTETEGTDVDRTDSTDVEPTTGTVDAHGGEHSDNGQRGQPGQGHGHNG